MRLAVLSPHLDDAVFSLAITLASCANESVTVVNVFTRSAYAPRAIGRPDISGLRRREDRRALKSAGAQVSIRDFRLFDAPVRLALETVEVVGPKATTLREEDVTAVMQCLRRVHADRVLAPLGLGDHVDHRTVREAATHTYPRRRLAFYEDLPYATWTPVHQIAAVANVLCLRPQLVRGGTWRKGCAAALYSSQIARADAMAMARYSAALKGERIWVPLHSGAWP